MKNKVFKDPEDISYQLFSKADITWKTSKEKIWINLTARMKEEGLLHK